MRQIRGIGSNSSGEVGGQLPLSSDPMWVQRFQAQRLQPTHNTHSTPQDTDIKFLVFFSVILFATDWCFCVFVVWSLYSGRQARLKSVMKLPSLLPSSPRNRTSRDLCSPLTFSSFFSSSGFFFFWFPLSHFLPFFFFFFLRNQTDNL